jgi:hypothetical protein
MVGLKKKKKVRDGCVFPYTTINPLQLHSLCQNSSLFARHQMLAKGIAIKVVTIDSLNRISALKAK